MSDIVVDLASLSEEVREKLAELDLELSEGEWIWCAVNHKVQIFRKKRSISEREKDKEREEQGLGESGKV